jgi:hypothetical protein
MRLLIVLALATACTRQEPRSNVRTVRALFQAAPYGDFSAHVARLEAKLKLLGLGHMHVRVEPPFVVIGDGSRAGHERSAATVRWARDKLEQDFFVRRPTKIIDIYLFQTAASYQRGVRRLTGAAPSTPYGFYSPSASAMYMNISTGGGTLVHEIVHPYVEVDFPDAPAWLNEGLGSLFEQSAERDGQIVGLPNWRLDGLQRSIRRGELPSVRTLTHLPREEFYGDLTGTHYAMARYLMYYLQERGALHGFYRAFRAARSQDPTGYRTLSEALRERDMRAFERRWHRFVLQLEFP